jgi:hypothetical protein
MPSLSSLGADKTCCSSEEKQENTQEEEQSLPPAEEVDPVPEIMETDQPAPGHEQVAGRRSRTKFMVFCTADISEEVCSAGRSLRLKHYQP